MVNRAILDDQRPGWHVESGSASIQHWMFDPRQPKEFLVYPPATTSAQLEVVYTAPVGEHALSEENLDPSSGSTTTILLDDLYAGPIVDWILYRAYSKDAEYGENQARAAGHFQAFSATIGVKNSTDAAVDPKIPSKVT